MAYIFISYSRHDRQDAQNIAELIRDSGFDIWFDDHIDYGHRWWQTVVDGINNCAAFVVLMSPNSEQSEWIEREVLVAQRQDKPIFPLLLTGQVFPLLITTQYFDMTGERCLSTDFYMLLKQAIHTTQKQGSYITPAPQANVNVSSEKQESTPLKRGFLILFLLMIAIILFLYFKWDIETRIQGAMPHTIVRSYPDWTPQEHTQLDVEMVLVPAGCFIDKLLHSQCFRSTFWIDKYEVTQSTFDRLGGIKAQPSAWEGDNLPVTNITAEEALFFCQTRGGRLPTGLEWEYASLSRAGRIHSLAIQIDISQTVTAKTSNHQLAEVGTYPNNASWIGALDLFGNVWEWTSTSEGYYTLRGGSWRSLPETISIALMMSVIPDFTSDDAGFRCVIEG